ncbi:MAG: hypothetical protein GF416_00465 [Candidatus Altiarchaeales archaeon]|nr:hypothetical protein [Candidatus Altiarchaeales archaeon]MBD3415591.1 hypothetical protein [Candidatus Altiarchaeales archaeon]
MADAFCYLLDNPDVCERLVEGANSLLDRSGKRRKAIVPQMIELYGRLAPG